MIDRKDEKILKELKQNARKTTKAISKNIKIPRVTVHDRINKLVEQKIIKSFTVSIDYEKIGLPTEVFIFISFLPTPEISQRQLAKKIAELPGIYAVYIISGEYDLLLKARGESLKQIGKLVVDKLRILKGVGKTLTFTCFETIKEEI